MVMGNALQESKGAKGAKLQSIRKLFETDAACEDPARRATLLPSAGASAWQRKQKRTDMLIEIAPFAPEKSGSGQLPKRSEAYPRRAQSTFDGSAVESVFALLLTKVTKPPAGLNRRIHP